MPAQPAAKSFLPSDILYFVTFLLGIAAFWLSGQAVSALHLGKLGPSAVYVAMVVTAVIYGAIIAVWTVPVLKRLSPKAMLTAAIPAVVLGIAAGQTISRLAAGHVKSLQDLGFLTFGLYVCYGLIYVVSLLLARKLTKST